MTDISASEARQNFADILRRASTGETFTVLREGYAVAQIGPVGRSLGNIPADTNLGISPQYRPEPENTYRGTNFDPAAIPGVSKGPPPKLPFNYAEYRDIVLSSGGLNSKNAAKYRLTHDMPDIDPDSQVAEDEL